MSEPAFTVILNGEGEILNLAVNVASLAEGIRRKLIGIPPVPPGNDCAKMVERAHFSYVAGVIDKQRAIVATLVRAIADLEALNAEMPEEKPAVDKYSGEKPAVDKYSGGAATGGVGTHLGAILCGSTRNR